MSAEEITASLSEPANDSPLAVTPKRYAFNVSRSPDAESKLVGCLQRYSNVSPVVIRRLPDVLLNETGLIRNKFRLTTTGLSQLCSALSPGLGLLVADLAGLRGSSSSRKDKAIAVLNTVIATRFDSLRGSGLVIDQRNQTVDGLVGQRYEFFSNRELLERCQQFISELQSPDLAFYEAIVSDRRLLLRYMPRKPTFMLATPGDKPEPYFVGWSFSNSELGSSAVRASLSLLRGWSRSIASTPLCSVKHVRGDSFGKKFDRMLDDLQRKTTEELKARNYPELFARLQTQPLLLGGSPVAHAKQVEKLASKLRRVVFKRVASKIVFRAITHGSYRADYLASAEAPYDMLSPADARIVSGRVYYDYFNAITFVARSLQLAEQEAVEQFAYRMLVSRSV